MSTAPRRPRRSSRSRSRRRSRSRQRAFSRPSVRQRQTSSRWRSPGQRDSPAHPRDQRRNHPALPACVTRARKARVASMMLCRRPAVFHPDTSAVTRPLSHRGDVGAMIAGNALSLCDIGEKTRVAHCPPASLLTDRGCRRSRCRRRRSRSSLDPPRLPCLLGCRKQPGQQPCCRR